MPEVHFGEVRWGYGWIFPKRNAITIGLGGLQRKNGDMRPLLTHFIEKTTGLTSGYRIKGHHIPFGDFRKTPGACGALLAGRCGRSGGPDHRRGQSRSPCRAAKLAAQAILAARAAPGQVTPCSTTTPQPATRVQRHRHGKALRNLIFPGPMERLFTRALPRSTRTPRLHMDLLSGAIEYPAYTRQLLGRLLRRGAQALRHGPTPLHHQTDTPWTSPASNPCAPCTTRCASARPEGDAQLDVHATRFIGLSPLVVLSSAGASGAMDASPRGGEPGFVKVLDPHTLLIPDAPGNNRLDTLQNIVMTGSWACCSCCRVWTKPCG